MVVTRRFQKNRQNGQHIRLLVDRDHPDICPALALANMALRKTRFKHSLDLPLAVFKEKNLVVGTKVGARSMIFKKSYF